MGRRPVLWLALILFAVFVYDAVLRSLLTGLVVLPQVPGGLKVLTAVLALFSLCHAWYSLGGRLTGAFFVLSAVVSWAFEQVGVLTGLVFGAYHYTDYLGGKLGEVPLLIPLAWFMMIYPSYVTANLALAGRPLGTPRGSRRLAELAAASAVVMTLWDLVIDPILSGPDVKAWIWETGGPYFGIPVQNYFGWLLTTFTVYLCYRAIEQRWSPGGATAGLGTAGNVATGTGGRFPDIGVAVAALPVAAYGLMLVANLISGVAPAGLAVIGCVVMGVPFAVASVRLAALSSFRPPSRLGAQPMASSDDVS